MGNHARVCIVLAGVLILLGVAVAPRAAADIIIVNVTRTLNTDGSATDGLSGASDSFTDSDSSLAVSGDFNSSVSGDAYVKTAWSSGDASLDSSIGAASFFAAGSGTVIAGTVEDPDFAYYSDATAHSVFTVVFTLTTPYLMDLDGYQGYVWGDGAAMDMGGVSLTGSGVSLLYKDESFDLMDYLLLPGTYTLEGHVSITCDSPPGSGGGESGVEEQFSLNCVLRSAAVPEPATITLLGMGALALALRRARKAA